MGLKRKRPRRATRRTRFKRRRIYRAKRKYKKSRLTTCKVLGFRIPDSTRIKLRDFTYYEAQLTNSAKKISHRLVINSLYDPDTAIGGGQPRLFDQYMGLYKHYMVYGCKVDVVFKVDQTLTTSEYLIASITGSDSPSIPSYSWSGINQQPFTVHKPITNFNERTFRLSKYFSIQKLSGMKLSAHEPEFSGTSSSSPDNSVYAHVALHNPKGELTGDIYGDYLISLTFYVKFYSPSDTVIDS